MYENKAKQLWNCEIEWNFSVCFTFRPKRIASSKMSNTKSNFKSSTIKWYQFNGFQHEVTGIRLIELKILDLFVRWPIRQFKTVHCVLDKVLSSLLMCPVRSEGDPFACCHTIFWNLQFGSSTHNRRKSDDTQQSQQEQQHQRTCRSRWELASLQVVMELIIAFSDGVSQLSILVYSLSLPNSNCSDQTFSTAVYKANAHSLTAGLLNERAKSERKGWTHTKKRRAVDSVSSKGIEMEKCMYDFISHIFVNGIAYIFGKRSRNFLFFLLKLPSFSKCSCVQCAQIVYIVVNTPSDSHSHPPTCLTLLSKPDFICEAYSRWYPRVDKLSSVLQRKLTLLTSYNRHLTLEPHSS